MYSFIEGFRSEDIIKNDLRRLYRIYCAITLIYIYIISTFGYILTTNSIKMSDLMSILSANAAGIYTCHFLPFMTHYYRKEVRTIIERIDNNFNFCQTLKQCSIDGREKYNVVSLATKLIVFLGVIYSLIAFPIFIYATVFCDQNYLGDQQLFLYGVPFVNQIHSYKVYVPVYWSILVLTFCPFLNGMCIVIIPIMIGCEFHNAYFHFCIHFHQTMDDSVSKLKAVSGGNENDTKTVDSELFHSFKNMFAVSVRHQRLLVRSLEELKPFMEILSAVNLFSFFSMTLPMAYALILGSIPSTMKIKMVALFMLECSPLYTACYFGKLYEEMNKMMSEEIYFSRWYDLPPKYRKLVHIFAGQTQKLIQFTAFKMYSLTMNTFSKALNFVYTVINLQRNTLIRKQ